MKPLLIRYNFTLADDSSKAFDLQIDSRKLELINNMPEVPPFWTELDFYKCPNCLLSTGSHPNCPLAANIVNIVKSFHKLMSYDEIQIEVTTDERIISQKTTAQKGLSSLMGLVIATSGCPHTVFLKPMARFHLPLANKEETIYRAASMYLLAQYFLKNEGCGVDLEFEGLIEIYDSIQIVNTYTARRLQASSEADSPANAITLLHVYSMALPLAAKESLEKLRYLFAPYIRNMKDVKEKSFQGDVKPDAESHINERRPS